MPGDGQHTQKGGRFRPRLAIFKSLEVHETSYHRTSIPSQKHEWSSRERDKIRRNQHIIFLVVVVVVRVLVASDGVASILKASIHTAS
ncbi:hypothetical protein M438DRAFT_28985 [Aureobasidium pullulans EXF-150]|uniref:Uncharacterized protein n=1 Tax=Aureobasidium pullulans EXF-150 TaxID=1043002 RepID=A0A074XKE4_AURPU|nr:uncharacterized protein M438DRAFT_28985 [Aureobasidium pullulans EXF-150]KEQ84139.1 hypothetical protein M438DRAFT_28985 [Aureobasidium pullulans EXF-150]